MPDAPTPGPAVRRRLATLVGLRGIRARLAMLALLIVAPMMVLMWVGAGFERRRTLETARLRALENARAEAEQQGGLITEARDLLRILVRVPEVAGAGAQCHDLLAAVAQDHPRIDVLTVTDAQGAALCNSRDDRPDYRLGDRAYFRALMTPDPPPVAVSERLQGRRAGRPVVVVAVPLPQPRPGALPPGIASAALALAAATAPAPDGHATLVLDTRDGTLVAAGAPLRELVGRQFPDHPLLHAIRAAEGEGMADADDLTGTPSVFGFAHMPGTRHFAVAVGRTQKSLLGDADRRFGVVLAAAIGVACSATLLAWLAAHVWFLQPIRRIIAVVRAYGAGGAGRRIRLEALSTVELHALATTFNTMAATIERHAAEMDAAHAELWRSEDHHRALAENVADMITRFDPDFTRIYISPACRDILGYEPEELTGISPRSIVHPDDWIMLDAALNAPLRQGLPRTHASYRAIRKDGSEVWLDSRGTRVADGSGYVVVTTDISERKRFEAALEHANARLEVFARQDALTGLPNRRRFDEALQSEWQRAARERHALALLLIDVDQFKIFNDTYGHSAGDDCLRQLSDAVALAIRRPGDLAARYGGEELAVLLPQTDAPGALQMAERVAAAVRALCIPHPSGPLRIVTISIGVCATWPQPEPGGDSTGGLVERADAALYRAKADGRNRVALAPLSAEVRNIP